MATHSSDPRIDSMFSSDRLWALVALFILWGTYAFVFWRLFAHAERDGVYWALLAGGGLVLLFNTASIIAMIAHFAEDLEQIYGLDLHYIDEIDQARTVERYSHG